MVKRFYGLPSLTALAVFEASARHKSFKRAAEELNVTPGAVSRQIKAVEDELGHPMFTRTPAGVDLTPPGEELYRVLAQGFAGAADIVRRIRSSNRTSHVTIACTNSVALQWLIPRMGAFWDTHPDIVVDHQITDDPRGFRREEVELRIRYGFGAWPDEEMHLLLDEVIYPVAGPAFAERHAGATRDDLPDLALLHVSWVDPDWTDWEEFLTRAGIEHGKLGGARFGIYPAVVRAAEDNRGVALGWNRLVEPNVEAGRLVRFTDLAIPAPGSYYLTWNRHRPLTPPASTLRDWLIAVADREADFSGNAQDA
ncbi:MAG: LysR substrate-binding domain-containing protein [Rhodospirillaceae bacterium]|nr:LysR substrate-binding domain-containing protein [Rhodospirillaceae bacterium]